MTRTHPGARDRDVRRCTYAIIATQAFTGSTALWLEFSGGLALLLVSLRALAMHEADVEGVVHSLETNGFGVGVAAASGALLALSEHLLTAYNKGINVARPAAIAIATAAVAVPGALVVTMALHTSINYRWVAFGLGAAMVGVSVVASVVHELSTESVRHELEVAHAPAESQEVAEAA